jgi:EAL domain-containing protein (putative c-di-GMP-specific phosphodiesterase class I)
VGYELLGRANHPLLPKSPIELFGLAEAMDRELELSAAFRNFGISRMTPHLQGHTVFINAHPKETFCETFLASLETIHRASPALDIVVEIHESAVTDTMKLRELSRRLARLDIRFAYDDFGAGQARLLELADVPAHFVKFDMALIRDLHKASERKRQVVRDLVQMVLATGSTPLAEGVELEEEAQICIDMGFQLIQGYLTGRPIPAASL